MFLIGLCVGLMVGACCGFVLCALLTAGSDADREADTRQAFAMGRAQGKEDLRAEWIAGLPLTRDDDCGEDPR